MRFPPVKKGLVAAALILVATSFGWARAWAAPVQAGHIALELVAAGEAVPGQTLYLGLHQKIEPGWHTFWRNPGDAGVATEMAWTLPAGWTAGETLWPPPRRLPYAFLMNYGYEDEVILPVSVGVPSSAVPGSSHTLRARVQYQVCQDICIPGDVTVETTVKVAAGAPAADPVWGPRIAQAVASAPRPGDLRATFARDGETLRLSIAGAALAGRDFSGAYFFPYDPLALKHAEPQPIAYGPEGLTLTLAALNGPDGMLAGMAAIGGEVFEIRAEEGPPIETASGSGTLPAAVLAKGAGQTAAGVPAGPGGLLLMALFAFGGGLILNLMPCVFPILSMKAASLAGHGGEVRAARVQGLVFLAGVMTTFLLLAGALIAVRAAGSSVGWGFQLQSPDVTAALTLLMLLVALNFSGVFEIGLSVQGAGSGLASRAGLLGAFFTGVLAVVVAAPCTAPFMGPAVAYALAQPPAAALAVFAGLGFGFALPLVMLTFLPPLMRAIPRPGPWMAAFKSLLAFPMYGTAAWMAWVYTGQQGQVALAGLMAAAVLVALGAWLFGQGQRGRGRVRRVLLHAALPLALVLAVPILSAFGATPNIPREPWSAARVEELRAEGKVVFVDFTADWCVTCKVNEGTALASKQVAQAFDQANAAYLVGDWTNRDDAIAAELARHGRVGVPLYLVYGPEGDPQVLPQFLTPGIVREALAKARG